MSIALPLSLEPLLGSIFTCSMRGSGGGAAAAAGAGFSAGTASAAGDGGGGGGAAGGSVEPPHAASRPKVPSVRITANDEVFTCPPCCREVIKANAGRVDGLYGASQKCHSAGTHPGHGLDVPTLANSVVVAQQIRAAGGHLELLFAEQTGQIDAELRGRGRDGGARQAEQPHAEQLGVRFEHGEAVVRQVLPGQ